MHGVCARGLVPDAPPMRRAVRRTGPRADRSIGDGVLSPMLVERRADANRETGYAVCGTGDAGRGRAAMTQVPPLPRWLGLAGLLPQFACLLALCAGPETWRYAALAIAWGYAALIASFLGGLWWGIAASRLREGERVPAWLWIAAILPSLIALATYLPWVFGAEWPGPSLVVLALVLVGSLWVDRRIAPSAPAWWMGLRVPLSLGLGAATLLIALV